MTKKAISEAFEHLRPGEEMKPLEAAARSRSEADWVVGMNATRAASIRLRAAFDGAVSLGRVQTPTLALVARREEEIRAFKPEPYWLVEARFEASGQRDYAGRYLGGKRLPAEQDAVAIVEAVTGQPGEITKLEKKEEREQPQLLYDLTSLQRHANTLYGFSARRTLAAAQRLYEEHKALTYPRTNSRYLTGDMVAEIKPIAELVGHNAAVQAGVRVRARARPAAARARGQRQKVQDHHAIIPTRSEHDLGRMGQDELKVYDLVTKRFLAIFHPEAVYERTRVETTVTEHVFRTSGRRLVEAGWKGVYGEEVDQPGGEDDSGGDQLLPKLDQGETVQTLSVESMRKETQPPRRFIGRFAAGRDGDRRQGGRGRRAARGDEGLGHRHARHARLDHRAAGQPRVHRARGPLAGGDREGHPGDPAAERPPAHLAGADRQLGAPARADRAGARTAARRSCATSRSSPARPSRSWTSSRACRSSAPSSGPCPICGREISENRKGYSCWSREDPGCGFVIWKKKAGKSLPVAVAKELIASLRASRERGEDPGVGRTEKAVTGFRGRSGRTFRAKLRLEQKDEGKWRVEFDEDWAKEPPKDDAEGEGAAAEVAADAANSGEEEAEAPAAARAAGG